MLQEYDVLLLDVNYIFVRSYCAIDYVNEQGTNLSGVFGSLQTIQSQIKRANPKLVVAIFDGKGGSKKKKKYFPDYKAGRSIPVKLNIFKSKEEAQENFLFQLRKTNEFLSFLPINRVIIEGYEADEVIAYIANNYFSNKTKLIVSGDKDYHQLIRDDLHCYDLHNKKIITEEDLPEKWGSKNGYMIAMIRALIGDASDNLKGVHGFGLKTIQTYLGHLLEQQNITTVDEVKNFLLNERAIITSQAKDFASNWKTYVSKIDTILEQSNWDIFERNFYLMQLQDVDISNPSKVEIKKYLTSPISFYSTGYKKMLLQEGMTLEARRMDNWDLQYRNLLYQQTKFELLDKDNSITEQHLQ